MELDTSLTMQRGRQLKRPQLHTRFAQSSPEQYAMNVLRPLARPTYHLKTMLMLISAIDLNERPVTVTVNTVFVNVVVASLKRLAVAGSVLDSTKLRPAISNFV